MKENNKGVMILVVVLILVFLLPWGRINWGKIRWMQPETVTVTGEAKSTQKNQIATFNAGVDAVNSDKDKAISDVNSKMEAIIAAVKDFGIKEEDIKTQNLSIFQQEETYYEGGVQKSRKGQWRISNGVEIVLREVDKASKLTSLLTSTGANNVYGPNFSFDDVSETQKGLYEA
ncbi:MAG TPA: SIMPL domain-containing protein, partial [Candidatus Woesebacteria bacterium]|nr:SIMPL domain-containing protein [Candidatus Woesebacteria bacterium]